MPSFTCNLCRLPVLHCGCNQLYVQGIVPAAPNRAGSHAAAGALPSSPRSDGGNLFHDTRSSLAKADGSAVSVSDFQNIHNGAD